MRHLATSVRSILLIALSVSVVAPDAVLAQYGYHFGRNKVQYEAFDWHVLRTDHFDIYYYPEMRDLAEQGAHFAEEAYVEMQQRFASSLTHRVPLILYSSNLHFRQTNVTPGFIPDGVGGFFEFLKGRVVVPANGNLHQFRRVVRHELVHVFTYDRVRTVLRDHRIPPDRFLPLWFTEGLAEYWSGPRDYQHEMIMRDAVFNNYAQALSDIYRISGSFLMYKQGEALMHFLAETYGEESILRLVDGVWLDRDFRRVLEVILGEPFDTVSLRATRWLRERYYPDFPETDVSAHISQRVSTQGFAAKPAYHRRSDGTRRIYYVGNRTGYTNLYAVEVDATLRPTAAPVVLIRGERSDEFESIPAFESRLSVSTSGKLAFVTRSGAQDVIHIIDLESGAVETTLRFESIVAISSPDWSPDGHELIFAGIERSGYRNLYRTHTTRTSLEALTDDSYDVRDPSWSPDGSTIVFSSDRTDFGSTGAYNLFLMFLDDENVVYLTRGPTVDLAPRFSPDGQSIVFTSSTPDSSGRYSAQDIWTIDVGLDNGSTVRVAERLTSLASAAFDPVWADGGQILFSTYEQARFSIRRLDTRSAETRAVVRHEAGQPSIAGWEYDRIDADTSQGVEPYRKRYNLDLAQGAVSQTPVYGTTSGALLAFSDMLGDNHYFVTLYNSSYGGGSFLQNMNLSVARFHLGGRTNIGYGAFRFGGLRYDITDPDAVASYPLLRESIVGGFGMLSHPLSQFRRVEFGTSLSWNDKEIAFREIERSALLASGTVSLVHDHTLYGFNGPIDGARANVTVGYTRDVAFDNVNYLTLMVDARKYFRLGRDVTFASWGLFRANHGREARLWYLGGSWDLRGWRFFDVRGQKMWFTSHELRFPLVTAPAAFLPILQPFGIANLRGAMFADAAHAWNADYRRVEPQLRTGETLGAVGAGLRVNLFGGLVLRYDIGYRYRDGFRERERFFRQFFFGYDF